MPMLTQIVGIHFKSMNGCVITKQMRNIMHFFMFAFGTPIHPKERRTHIGKICMQIQFELRNEILFSFFFF